jgi:hypothetical protein
MQQAVTRSLACHRVYTQGIASNTGTERSVPVYGMNRRACDHESQPGTQTCKSIGDPVHEATITLRERQIPRVKQSASYECTTSRPHWHLHRIDGIIRFVTRLLRSWSSRPMQRCGPSDTTSPIRVSPTLCTRWRHIFCNAVMMQRPWSQHENRPGAGAVSRCIFTP